MKRYRVEFYNYEIKSITPGDEDVSSVEPFAEENTGDTIWAVLHAEDDVKAREKAQELSHSLQNGDSPYKKK